jgi:hypothetical protein
VGIAAGGPSEQLTREYRSVKIKKARRLLAGRLSAVDHVIGMRARRYALAAFQVS